MITLVNSLLEARFRYSFKGYLKAAAHPAETQRRILAGYLQKNRHTAFGREHRFGSLKNYDDFIKAVKPMEYEDYEPYIQRILRGEKDVLTAEPVRLLEPTSGSSGGKKLIPYTGSLQREYMAAILPWLADLYRRYPRLKKGSSYWSITPQSGESFPESTVPVGFDNDASYFGPMAPLIRRLFPVPDQVKTLKEMENFRYITCLLLLADSTLSLISLWNPSFLTLLGGYIHRDKDRLTASLSDGILRWPVPEEAAEGWKIRADRNRAVEVKGILKKEGSLETLWPNLQLISCWTDGHSASLIPALREFFPRTEIQPKGLLATEGVLSLPLKEAEDPVLACTSHFFEFQDCRNGEFLLAHELEKGRQYEPLITTGGGLVRYRLGDIIEVQGFYGELPSFRFMGRSRTVDLAGEKMSEAFVSVRLRLLFNSDQPDFLMLAPRGEKEPSGYCLYHTGALPQEKIIKLEGLLRENFHYRYARDLGQLEKVIACPVPNDGLQRYLAHQCRRGQRLGDIKIPALYLHRDLGECFKGGTP